MRVRSFLAAALLLASAPAGAQAAHDPTVAGRLCSGTFVHTAGDDHGVLTGGPVAAADVATVVGADPLGLVLDNPVSVTLTCSVRNGYRHDAPDLVTVSATGDAVAVLPPTPVVADLDEVVVAVCSRVTVVERDGTTHELYWDSGSAEFSASGSGYCGGPECLASRSRTTCDTVGAVLDRVFEDADPLVCEDLAWLPDHPPVVERRAGGDLYVAGELWYDCPPFEE